MTEEIINLRSLIQSGQKLAKIDRLEQENEELKEVCKKCKLFDIEKTNRDLLEQIDKLEQENKELKEENIEYDEELAIEKLSHKSDLETLERYRSALEEINECANFARCLPCVNKDCDCANCDDEITNNGQFCMEKQIEEIKQIINEVLNDTKTN